MGFLGISKIYWYLFAFLGLPLAVLSCYALWAGIFFGVNYPEIKIHNRYKSSSCTVLQQENNPYTCCQRTCQCTECVSSLSTCSNLEAVLKPGEVSDCCAGYYCCKQCCQTCRSCSGTGKGRSCSYYNCNCYCCNSVKNRACTTRCFQCYRPKVIVSYPVSSSQYTGNYTSNIYKDCKQDGGQCVTNFFSSLVVNSELSCYYDPNNFPRVVLSIAYSKGKIAGLIIVTIIAAVPTFVFIVLGGIILGYILYVVFKDKLPDISMPTLSLPSLPQRKHNEPPRAVEIPSLVKSNFNEVDTPPNY